MNGEFDVPPVDVQIAEAPAAPPLPTPPSPPVSAPAASPVPPAPNEYAEVLKQQRGVDQGNEYADVLRGQMTPVVDLAKEREQRLRATAAGARDTTPEATAKALDLSNKTGMSVGEVERNLPRVEADQKLNEYTDVLAKSPKLGDWLLADPTNAKVAGADYDKLAKIERILKPRHMYDLNRPSKFPRSIDSESADWEATAFPNAGGLVYDRLPSFDAPLYESQLKKGVEGIARSGNDWSQNSLLLAVQAIDFFDRGGSPYRGRGGYGMGLGIGDFSRMANDPQPQPKQERHADVFGYLQMSDDQKAALKKRIDFDLVLLAAKKQLGQEFVSRLPADPNTKPFLDSFNAVDGKALLNALTRSLTNVLLGNYLRAVDLAPTGGESPLKGVTDEFSKGPGGIVQELAVTNIPNAIAMAPALAAGPLAPLVAGGIGVGLDLPERLNGLIKQTFAETATIESLPLDHNNPFVVQQWLRDNPEAMNKLLSNAAAASMAISAGEVFSLLAMKPLPMGKGATAIVARGAANAGIGVLSEGSGEFFAQMVADNYDAGELAAEMIGAGPSVVIGTAAKTVQDVSRAKVEAEREAAVADVKKTITAATDFLNDLRTHVAETETLTLDDLVDKVQGSTLHKLSPEKMKDFLESLSPDEQKADVFISSDAVSTLFQDMSVLERDTLAENLGITEQLNSLGLNANTDIVIPLPVYLTAIGDAHKAWRDDVRMDFMGFSNREAIAEGKAKAEETAAAVARFEEQVAAGVQDSPQEIVYQQVLGMLKANGFTNEQASQQAAYAASRYHARAVRSPQMFTDALDAFTQYPFTIRSHLGDGIRVIGPDQLDIMLDSIRSGKDPVVTPAFAHIEARKAAADAELSTVLGEAPVVKTPKQIADERKAAALGVFQARRQELVDWLESRGLDLKTATNAQIRAEIEKVQKGTSYEQDDVLVVKQPLSDSLIMVAQRGDRATGNRLLLSTEEKAAIAASVGPSGLSVEEITATVRKHKLAHPPAQNWEPLVFIKARLDKKGKPEFMYKLVPYSFIRDNDGKDIQPSEKKYAGRVKALGDAIAEEVRGIYRRAAAGDKNAQNILAQAGWYKAMRARLRQEFGGLGDLFADALGATSPNTPVRGNWENAVDSLRRASRGDFDALMPRWVAWSENIDRLETDLRAFVNEQRAKKQASKSEPWMDSDKPQTLKSVKEMQEYIDKRKALSEARELPPDLMPTKESGAQYGFNGRNVVRAMLNLWRTIKDADPDIGRSGTAPKALNFSGNLIGFRGKATIDVWAARLLQRLAGKRRIPSMAEIAVSGEMLADASTTGQFGFGQDTFAHAVAVIRSDSEMRQDSALAKINDDDLQAVVWFIEKEVWTVNNWTSVSGEGGSFELEANLTGTAKQARVRELRKIIDSSPSAADVKAVAGADAVSAKVEAWDAEHKAELDELGEINQRLASETPSKKEASDLKKRAKELQKATKLPKEIAQEMRDVANGQRRIDERAAQKVLARAELATLERPVDRYVGGLSTQMSIDNQGVDYVPTDADMARLGDAIRLAIYENDATANVLASKALPTEGRYGSVERSLDLEIVAREGYDPSTVWAEMLRQAQEARQDSTFLSRVLRDGEEIDYTKHRPGIEIYFRDAAAAQQLEKMLADLAKEGVSFLTVSVDGRRMPGYVAGAMPAAVGVRLQYVPEFEQRYGNDDLSGLDDAAIADKMKAKGDELDDVAMRVATNVSGVSFAGVFWHETQVAFSHQYQEKIDGLATGRTEAEAGATGPGGWVGQSVRAGLADADRQSREAASGEPGGQREPVVGGDEGSTGRAGKGVTLDQDKRGSITFGDTSATVDLYQARNPSTLLHEMWHKWFGEFEFDVAHLGASEQMRADFKVLLDFVGSTDGRIGLSAYEGGRVNTLRAKIDATGEKSLDGAEAEEWAALKVRIEQNEKLARAGEVYLMEGKAPSDALRKVFRAFKSWLLGVYRDMRRLQAPISPEVRAVLDRMLATDEEIASLNDRQGLNPVLKSAKDGEMSKAEFAAYTKKTADVLEDQQDALFAKVSGDLRKQAKGEYDKERAKIRGEVTDEMMAEPGQQALHFLKKGVMLSGETPEILKGRKLSRAGLIELIGQEGLNTLPAGIHAEEGLSLDEMAPLFGLGNGMELADRLMQIAAEDKAWKDKGGRGTAVQSRIAEETQRRLTEALGDPLNDGSIEAEAWAIVHSDKRLDLMAVDLRMLARKAGQTGAVSIGDIQNWAAEQIGGMSSYQATQVARYQRAERMAGQQVQKALVKGDWVAAFKAKQDQVYNFALYKEAKKAADDADSIRKRMDRYASAAQIKSMDQGALNAIHEILEEFDFKKRSGALLAERTLFNAFAEQQKELGIEVLEPPRLKGAGSKHFSQMTMEELRGLSATIEQMAKLGRMKKELIDNQKKRDFEAVVEEGLTTAAAQPQRGVSRDDTGLTPFEERMGKLISGIKSGDSSLIKLETLFEWLDGDKTGRGIFTRMGFKPFADAQGRERDRLVGLNAKLKALYALVPQEQRDQWLEVHSIQTLPKPGGRPGKFNKTQLIAMALNIGNQSNLEKLTVGMKWDEVAVRATLDKYLTREEWALVQGVWDLIETQWPELKAVHERVTGLAPPKIEPIEVKTPYGTLKGGYYPAVYDPNLSTKAAKIGAKADVAATVGEIFPGGAFRPSTRAGATHARTGFEAPIRLSLDVIVQHLTDVSHDIEFREAIINAHKFFSDERIKQSIIDAVGPEYEEQIDPWLKNIAHEWVIDRQGLNAVQKFANVLRTNVVIVGLGFRISTMLAQTAGYANSVQRLGAAGMADGMRAFAKNPVQQFQFVHGKSAEMRHRANDLERDLRAAQLKMQGKTGFLNDVRRFAFAGIAAFDAAVSIPTWIGAYNQGLSEHKMTDEQAVYYADKMVRDTQGSGAAKDMAAIQRGGPLLKLFTMFYSYFNVFYNRQRSLARDVRDPGVSWGSVVAQTFWLLVVPSLLSPLLTGQGPGDDEEWAAWAARNVFFGLFTGVPYGRDIANAASSKMAGKPFGDPKLSPVEGFGSNVVRLGNDIWKAGSGEDVSKTFIKNLFNVAGVVTALPLGQPGSSAQYVWDVLVEGSENPENLLEWMRGLTIGPKK